MKKSPIFLYILGALSTISVLSQIKGTFFPAEVTTVVQKTGDAQTDKLIEATADIAKQTAVIETNLVNKFLLIVMIGLLVAVAFFLFKEKNVEKAGWTYVGYLGTTLLGTAYSFLIYGHVFRAISDSAVRQMLSFSFNIGMGVNVLLFAIFLGITLYHLLKKPKVTTGDTTGTI